MMITKTDLNKVKEMAKLLVEYPIEPCCKVSEGLGSFFLSHPIFRDRIISKPVPKTEENPVGLEMLDIVLKENQEEARKLYRYAIDKQRDVFGIFMIINKPYAGFFFNLIKDFLNEEDYATMLEYLWTSMEYPNTDKNVSKYQFIDLWKKANLSYIYSDEDKDVLARLPEEFLVYRGLMKGAKKQALSWTLDPSRAVWFAKRFDNNGKVYKALCKKKDILVYLSCRNEEEIVVDWRKLKNIEEISYV